MTRKPLLWLLSISLVIVLMLSGLPTKIHAQDSNPETPSDFPVSIELTGTVATVTADSFTLDDGTVVKLNQHTTGTENLKVGTAVVVTAELDDENLVAQSITVGDGTDAVNDSTSGDTSGTGDTNTSTSDNEHGKGKNKDAANNNDSSDNTSVTDKGHGKGKDKVAADGDDNGDNDDSGSGNNGNNGKGNGKNKCKNANNSNSNGNGNGNGKCKNNDENKDEGNKDKGNGQNEAQCLARTDQHPVAARLADALGVDYATIWAWHCKGNGFGEIARAYLIARAANVDVSHLFDMRDQGTGWGKIIKDLGLHPGDFAPGKLMKLKSHGKGHGNKDKDKGNNGNNNGDDSDDS